MTTKATLHATRIVLTLSVLGFVSPAFAKDELDLYPKARAAYIAKYDDTSEKYQADARDYVNDLYKYRAEGPKAAPKMPEADLDAYIDNTAKPNSDSAAPQLPTAK